MKRDGEQPGKWPTLQILSFNRFHEEHQNPGEPAHWVSNGKGSPPAPTLS